MKVKIHYIGEGRNKEAEVYKIEKCGDCEYCAATIYKDKYLCGNAKSDRYETTFDSQICIMTRFQKKKGQSTDEKFDYDGMLTHLAL